MSELISPEYLDQLHKMRAENHRPRWGNGGQRHVPKILELIAVHQPASILDYGCGLGMLIQELTKFTTIPMVGYDPGIPERSVPPDPADLVVSTDVLEHVEPDRLVGVLTHLKFLTGKVAYLNIHTGPATVERVKGFDGHRPSFVCLG
jgi:2-polyprenyl-3-methyl-5-hydroxy-6-metoxy-1,4-benzoquinol methylase